MEVMILVSFPVSEKKMADLVKKMAALGIREEDLAEDFIRGSGAGGQKINKTSAVVLLSHRPSGIQVRCQEGRSQGLNRYYARKRLVEKLEFKVLGAKSALQQKIEKLRRQKRKRSKRAKEKVLKEKKHTSLIKQTRRSPPPDQD